jgi:hypothetical protein
MRLSSHLAIDADLFVRATRQAGAAIQLAPDIAGQGVLAKEQERNLARPNGYAAAGMAFDGERPPKPPENWP